MTWVATGTCRACGEERPRAELRWTEIPAVGFVRHCRDLERCGARKGLRFRPRPPKPPRPPEPHVYRSARARQASWVVEVRSSLTATVEVLLGPRR